jgi:hypothetical protein
MKKTMMILLAVSLVFALALPAMAETAVEFSGRYFVRGTVLDNMYMSDDDAGFVDPSQSYDDRKQDWYDQELRMNVKFIANENVSVNMRMDIGDYNWGTRNYFAGLGTAAAGDEEIRMATLTAKETPCHAGRKTGHQTSD